MRSQVRRSAQVLAVGGVLLVWCAGPAGAAVTATKSGSTTVSILSDATADTISVSCLSGNVAVNGTEVTTGGTVACTALTTYSVTAGGGMDTLSFGSVSAITFPALVAVSAAIQDATADTYVGSQVKDSVIADGLDTVSGGAGDDYLEEGGTVDGGDGSDLIVNAHGAVTAGAGNDTIIDPVSGPLNGGDGDDVVSFDLSRVDTLQPTSIVLTDITSSFDLGSGVGTAPTAAIEEYDLRLPDNHGAAQSVDARAFSGRTKVWSYGGADTLFGAAGTDVLDSGDGNDVISVRDGAVDVVRCGDGNDTVTADRVDVLSGCENVSLPAPDTSRISGAKKVAQGEKAVFEFESTVTGSSFECRIDKAAFKACTSPFKVKTKKLKPGKHTVEVRAVAGSVDPTPSTLRFKVLPKH